MSNSSYDYCYLCGVKIDYGNYLEIGKYIFCGDKKHCSYHNNCKDKINKNWLSTALKQSPEGEFCTFCGETNLNFDDCGFFYILGPDNKFGFACDKCYNKYYYKYHVPRYGIGDR